MSSSEYISGPEKLEVARTILSDRLAASSLVILLSDRGGKTVELFEEENGMQFIKRIYPGRWSSSNMLVRGKFPDLLTEFANIFKDAGITLAPHQAFSDETGHNVLTEKIVGVNVSDAALETKIALAAKFGEIILPDPQSRYKINSIVLQPDMFVVLQEDGQETPILVDIDPELSPNITIDSIDALYISRITEIFYDHWCKGNTAEERVKIMSALCRSIALRIDDDCGMETVMAMSTVNLMGNGVDPRNRSY